MQNIFSGLSRVLWFGNVTDGRKDDRQVVDLESQFSNTFCSKKMIENRFVRKLKQYFQ